MLFKQGGAEPPVSFWTDHNQDGVDPVDCRTVGRRTPGHEFGRADGNVAHNAGGPGVSEEKHRGPGGFPPDVPAGWSGAVPAPGATQSRDGGQSKCTNKIEIIFVSTRCRNKASDLTSILPDLESRSQISASRKATKLSSITFKEINRICKNSSNKKKKKSKEVEH